MGGATGPPIVNIGGKWGTVCADNFGENAAEFFCRNLMTGGAEISSISHKKVELHGEFQEYPVLTDVQCQPDAESFRDCTSGHMGFSNNCTSGKDVVLACQLYFDPSQ